MVIETFYGVTKDKALRGYINLKTIKSVNKREKLKHFSQKREINDSVLSMMREPWQAFFKLYPIFLKLNGTSAQSSIRI